VGKLVEIVGAFLYVFGSDDFLGSRGAIHDLDGVAPTVYVKSILTGEALFAPVTKLLRGCRSQADNEPSDYEELAFNIVFLTL
jgi:hypothetical protein